MTRITGIALAVALAFGPVAASAQDEDVKEGFNLIEEGTRLLLRELTNEIEPLMEGLATEMEPKLRAFAEDLMPMLEQFAEMVGDLDSYHPPEKLPNGDIILRRKTPEDAEPAEDGEIEL